MSDEEILALLKQALADARSKHPAWPKEEIDIAAIIAEEALEVLQAAIGTKYEGFISGATQIEVLHTMTVCWRALQKR